MRADKEPRPRCCADPDGYAAAMDTPDFDQDILRYYDESDEDDRIRSGLHELELVRTQEVIRRHLPGHPQRILDVGGGGGVHAEWLLDDGHKVHLVDPVPRHVDQAVTRLGSGPRFSAEVGDSRRLSHASESFDAVLLLGPLYHLTDEADRLQTWREARRVARPGGLVFGVGISRFAELEVGLGRELIFDNRFKEMLDRTLVDGQHRNPPDRNYFTTAYYHHPHELSEEASEAGWVVRTVLGIEGFAGAMPHLEAHWNDPERRRIIVDAARAIETEPTLLGLGPHIMVIAERGS